MKIFIGSSSENTETLDEVSQIIEQNGHEPIAWNEAGLFLPGSYTANRLIEIAKNEVDAAILVFSPDDEVWYRGTQNSQPRDNVVFEHGLFSGVLGLQKAIIIMCGNKSKIPTDLKGLTYINYNQKARSKIELKKWFESVENGIEQVNTRTSFNIENIDLKYFLSFQEDMRTSIIDFVSEIYWSYDIEDCKLEEYLTFVITSFIHQFIGINDARFTIRQFDEESNSMVTYITTRQDAIPAPIPLDKPNLISESAKQNKPLIYSENKPFHFSTKNKSIKKGVYHDYVSYCLLEKEDNTPIFSICLDVKNQTPVNRMRAMVHSLVFEIMCNPIIEKFHIEIDKLEKH